VGTSSFPGFPFRPIGVIGPNPSPHVTRGVPRLLRAPQRVTSLQDDHHNQVPSHATTLHRAITTCTRDPKIMPTNGSGSSTRVPHRPHRGHAEMLTRPLTEAGHNALGRADIVTCYPAPIHPAFANLAVHSFCMPWGSSVFKRKKKTRLAHNRSSARPIVPSSPPEHLSSSRPQRGQCLPSLPGPAPEGQPVDPKPPSAAMKGPSMNDNREALRICFPLSSSLPFSLRSRT